VTTQVVADAAEQHLREVIDRYEAQRGSDIAVTGLSDVVARLRRGQVGTVLPADDPSPTDTLWMDPGDPAVVAVDDRELRESGVDPVRVRADSGLVRAIAGTGAELVLVQPGEATLRHGIGAVLRYADASTATEHGLGPLRSSRTTPGWPGVSCVVRAEHG
jgi:hypothetical protein